MANNVLRTIRIVGFGGFGREVAALLEDLPSWSLTGFFDDDAPDAPSTVPYLGPVNGVTSTGPVVVAVGSSHSRTGIVSALVADGVPFAAALVHPAAWVGPNVSLGDGSVVCANASLTTDISVGSHVHVNINATVGHDAVLADFVTLAPGVHVSGNVTLGKGVELGTGAVILPGVTLGEGAVVGAGAVVTKDVASNTTVVGMPAKVIG